MLEDVKKRDDQDSPEDGKVWVYGVKKSELEEAGLEVFLVKKGGAARWSYLVDADKLESLTRGDAVLEEGIRENVAASMPEVESVTIVGDGGESHVIPITDAQAEAASQEEVSEAERQQVVDDGNGEEDYVIQGEGTTGPQSGAELMQDDYPFDDGLLAILDLMRQEKPWRGEVPEKLAKFNKTLERLCAYYDLDAVWKLKTGAMTGGVSSIGPSFEDENTLIMDGKLSVVTFLVGFHKYLMPAAKKDERMYGDLRFALNLYRKTWPKQFEKMEFQGFTLVKKQQSA